MKRIKAVIASIGIIALAVVGLTGTASASPTSPQPAQGTNDADFYSDGTLSENTSSIYYTDVTQTGHSIVPNPGVALTLGRSVAGLGPRTASCALTTTDAKIKFTLGSFKAMSNVDENNTVVYSVPRAPANGTKYNFNLNTITQPRDGGKWIFTLIRCTNNNANYQDYA